MYIFFVHLFICYYDDDNDDDDVSLINVLSSDFFIHALCVNSVQDWVSNNRLKISLAKQSMHFVINVKRQAEPSNLLDKNPIKLVTEAKFLGVVFD